ncbi:MAG: CPBP family intramembrane metalloprotease [Nitrospirae bacterium]|nr:CPBP family intramembrane metalloprotease [Nitrospirota bacterium]
MTLNRSNLKLGSVVSVLVLLPTYFVMSAFVGPWRLPPLSLIFHQFAMVSVPEEFFFRGFIQQSLGNDMKAVITVSALFALAHVPAFFFSHDPSALFTFFPSLVMGFLYLRTGNVVPPILFHFLSNVVYQGFMI